MLNPTHLSKIGKPDLIRLIAEKMNMTQRSSQMFLDTFFEVLMEHLHQRKEIVLPGFMRISIKKRAKRTARHPKTGKVINIPEKEVIQIKAGNKLVQVIES